MKPRVKKAMRVATTFTGAAACAIGVGPAATAATHTHQFPVMTPNIRPDNNTEGGSCKGGTSNWVHMAYGYPNTHDYCYGFRGAIRVDFTYSMICGGNNIGWYSGRSDSGRGKYVDATYHQGTTYARLPGAPLYVSAIGINSFSGTEKCPPPPGIIITGPRQ